MIEIIAPPNLISVVKNKHLLLDTNVFIDCSLNPQVFINFLNSLKQNQITLTTIDLVKIEFLKGAPELNKFKEKESLFNSITDHIIPITADITKNVYSLINKYKINGAALSVTDLYLGACLSKFKNNLLLLTKDTTDFPQNIFNIKSIINITYPRSIHLYGIYQCI